MIKTVADLFDALVAQEVEVLDAFNISHAPTIGRMYEGLTADLVGRSIPTEAPLKVVSGFIVGHDGRRSLQQDVMLVTGDTEPVPYTDLVLSPVGQVLAVIEVKKQLDKEDIIDGYKNLRSVSGLDPTHGLPNSSGIEGAFRILTRQSLPEEIDVLSPEQQQIYHYLVVQASQPARILLGYHGHTTEGGFRGAISAHVQSLVGQHGHGPIHLPTLIMNREFSVAKMDALPWGTHVDEDGFYPLLASVLGQSQAMVLLESIWSRLNFRGLLHHSAFGEDLELDTLMRLIDMRPDPSKQGWEYRIAPSSVRRAVLESPKSWEPHEVSKEELVVLGMLFAAGELDKEDFSPDALPFIESLIGKDLVGRVVGCPSRYTPLTIFGQMAHLPDGRFVAGENHTGRLTRWAVRNSARILTDILIPDESEEPSQ